MLHNAANLLVKREEERDHFLEYCHTIPAPSVKVKGFEAAIQVVSTAIAGFRPDAFELVRNFIEGAEDYLSNQVSSVDYQADLARHRLIPDSVSGFKEIKITELTYENCFWNFVLDGVYYRNNLFLKEFLKYLREERGLNLAKKLALRHSVLGILLEDECIKEDNRTSPVAFDVLKTLIEFGLKVDRGFAVLLQTRDLLDPEIEWLLGVNSQRLFHSRCLNVLNSFLRDDELKAKVAIEIPLQLATQTTNLPALTRR